MVVARNGRIRPRPKSEMACIQRRLTIEATIQLPLVIISYEK